jgi:hypothetical protein
MIVTKVKIPETRRKLFSSEPNAENPKDDAIPIIASRAPETTNGKPKRIEKLGMKCWYESEEWCQSRKIRIVLVKVEIDAVAAKLINPSIARDKSSQSNALTLWQLFQT